MRQFQAKCHNEGASVSENDETLFVVDTFYSDVDASTRVFLESEKHERQLLDYCEQLRTQFPEEFSLLEQDSAALAAVLIAALCEHKSDYEVTLTLFPDEFTEMSDKTSYAIDSEELLQCIEQCEEKMEDLRVILSA